MDEKYDVIIIGAGSAGLSAFKEVSKKTDKVILIDKGPLGTTCARVGCMPSKVFIHSANAFFEKKDFHELGISGASALSVSIPAVFKRVRKLRDRFTKGIIDYLASLGDQFIQGEAKFIGKHKIQVEDRIFKANKIIIATGSNNVVPADWQSFQDLILTSDDFFEQEDLPKKMAVVGGGVIGLELGQAMSRLGVDVSLFHANDFIGGITDPVVNDAAIAIFKKEFQLNLGEAVSLTKNKENKLTVSCDKNTCVVDKALVSIGRSPNLDLLDLGKTDLQLPDSGIPKVDSQTLHIDESNLFLIGDANKTKPLLHEAADEGRIAGFNAGQSSDEIICFKRRASLSIIFTQPNIISVGKQYKALSENEIIIGEVSFEDQGRSRVDCINSGLLRVYVNKENGLLLGAEGIVPEGEHVAHLLAWALQKNLTVFDILQMPFYHPVVEEGMRTALRDAANKLDIECGRPFELAVCDSSAPEGLS